MGEKEKVNVKELIGKLEEPGERDAEESAGEQCGADHGSAESGGGS